MADSGFNLCDCEALNYYRSIQRLLEMIRENQQQCNERECLTNIPNETNSFWSNNFNLMIIFLIWVLGLSVMYVFWPNRQNKPSNLNKPKSLIQNNKRNDDNEPPSPSIQ